MMKPGMTREEFHLELKRAADRILDPLKDAKAELRRAERAARRKRQFENLQEKTTRAWAKVRSNGHLRALPDQGVYIIGCAGQPVKIGVAKNAASRLSEIQVGHPHPLRVYAHLRVAPYRAFEVERECHRRLADYRMNGEWFDYDPYEALALVREVIEALNAEP